VERVNRAADRPFRARVCSPYNESERAGQWFLPIPCGPTDCEPPAIHW